MYHSSDPIMIAKTLPINCKHILGIQMIIERHMSHRCGSLRFIDHAVHVLNEHITEIEVETDVELVEEKPYNIIYGGMGVQIPNDRGNYSMCWARVTIP